MKIVFTVHSYYPKKDGVQAVTRYLAEGLAKKNHKVIVITHSIEGEASTCIYNGVEIFRVNAETIHTFNFGDKNKVQELIKNKCADADAIINVCAQTVLTDWTFPLLEELPCKRILYLHGIIERKYTKRDFVSFSVFAHKVWNRYRSKYYYWRNKKYLQQYDVVTQLHRFDEGYDFFDKKLGIKSVVVENAADDSFFSKEEVKDNNLPEKYIIFVANYMERKNQEMIMKAYYQSNVTSYSLIFIGSEKNSYYDKLCELKNILENEYGKRDTRILTNIPREDVQKYVRCASIYALGSIWEAFPISIIESMAAGVPFISTDVGITKYLPGGVIVNSIEEMSYWFECLTQNCHMAKCLGNVGKIYAERNLRIEAKVDKLEDLINES